MANKRQQVGPISKETLTKLFFEDENAVTIQLKNGKTIDVKGVFNHASYFGEVGVGSHVYGHDFETVTCKGEELSRRVKFDLYSRDGGETFTGEMFFNN